LAGAASGSEGDPPPASSLDRFCPGDEAAAAAAVDGARRPDEVELMAAGIGGEGRRGEGRRDGRGNLGAREPNGEVGAGAGECGAPERNGRPEPGRVRGVQLDDSSS